MHFAAPLYPLLQSATCACVYVCVCVCVLYVPCSIHQHVSCNLLLPVARHSTLRLQQATMAWSIHLPVGRCCVKHILCFTHILSNLYHTRYDLFYQLAGGSHITGVSEVAEAVALLTVGAAVLGLLWAVVVIWMIGRVQSDMITEAMVVLAPCYILYYVAQFHLRMSGVLAVTVFGLCFPWWGNTRISPGLFPYVALISFVFIEVLPQKLHSNG